MELRLCGSCDPAQLLGVTLKLIYLIELKETYDQTLTLVAALWRKHKGDACFLLDAADVHLNASVWWIRALDVRSMRQVKKQLERDFSFMFVWFGLIQPRRL